VTLDIACGSGQSTEAVLMLADEGISTDASRAMITQADSRPRISYALACAESQPFVDAAFDLVTVSNAFHWFDRAAFLEEAARLLVAGGWLILYDNYFYARMAGNPHFEAWFREEYLRRYPSPLRSRGPLDSARVAAHGFELRTTMSYENDVAFTRQELVDYLMTQSNVIVAVEAGPEVALSVRAWLDSEIATLFATPSASFAFGGEIWFLWHR
jgi:SAM-dependent methyltransferase